MIECVNNRIPGLQFNLDHITGLWNKFIHGIARGLARQPNEGWD